MRRDLNLLVLSVLSATSFGATAHAGDLPSVPKKLSERRPGTVERAFKLGMKRQTRLGLEATTIARTHTLLARQIDDWTLHASPAKTRLSADWLKQGEAHLASLPVEIRADAKLDASMRST